MPARPPGGWGVLTADALITDPVHRLLVRLVLDGREPAEVLPGALTRECVIRVWHAAGLTDLDIARESRWTVHTVRRLRGRLGLQGNPEPLTWRESA